MKDFLQELYKNLSYVLECGLIVLAVAVIVKLVERKLPEVRKVSKARRITIIAVCSAVAAVLHMLDFPLLFLAPVFYKLDFSELPVMLCGFFLGPGAAIGCEAVKIILKLLLKGTSTAFIGDFANFAVGCSLVLPAVIVYHMGKRRKNAIIGLAVGIAFLTIFGSAFNAVYLLPKFSQFVLPLDTIVAMGAKINGNIHSVTTFVLLCVAPLNLLKGISVSLLTMLLYKRVARPLFGIRE